MSLEQRIFGRVLLPAALAATRDRRLRHMARLAASERFSPERLEALRLARLRECVEHAARCVPYYGELLRAAGLRAADLRSFDDLRQLPPLDKETIRRELGRLRATDVPARRVVREATGGSTGEPIEFFHDRDYLDQATAAAWRGRTWAGWRPGARMAWIWGAPQETGPARTLAGRARSFLQRNLVLDAFSASERDLADWTNALARFRPAFLYGYASSLAHYADWLRTVGRRIEGVRSVFTTAERLLPAQRASIEIAFACPVYDHYGSREVKAIAAQCEAGGMHVSAELVHVESDEKGALLVTVFGNRAMPLLRYGIGDHGRLVDAACSCGRTLPLLHVTIGRLSDLFVTPAGRVVHGEFFTHLLYDVPGIARFQFHQTAPERIALRIVRNGAFGPDALAGLARARLAVERELGDVGLEIEYVDEIPCSPTGKHRFTISDVAAGRHGART